MFRKLVLMFAIGYLGLLGVAVLGDHVVVSSLDILKHEHEHELDVSNSSRGVVRLMIDLEAAVRGYVLTGEQSGLDAYEKAKGSLPPELARFRTTVGDDPQSVALVDALDVLYEKWQREVAEPALAARRGAPPGPPSAELADQQRAALGKTFSDGVRADSQKLRDRTHEVAMEAERAMTAHRARLRHGIELGALVLALAMLLVALRTMRHVDRDVRRLAEDADRVASGKYVRTAHETASPLLQRIEHAMERATDALAWRDAESRALLAVSREVSAASSMVGLLARVQASVEEMMPAARLALVRLLPDEQQRVLATATELPLAEGATSLPENSAYRQVRDAARIFVVNDPETRRFAEDEVIRQAGFSAYAVISLFVADHVFAVVVVALRSGCFEPAQISFLETLVHQIAHQIEAAELRDSLAQSNEELTRATKAKSEFLAMMSHELRTPLNSVVGFSEVLADRKFGDLNDKQTRFIGNVLDSGRHLLRLINDLLDLSKIEAGQIEVSRQRCSPRALSVEVVDAVRPLADERRIRLTVEDTTPPLVVADPVRLKQILFNFLSNALKFAPQGGEVSISFSSSTDAVRIGVRDDGPGIALAEQERLFKPFTQLERATTSGSALGGTGLGLALARQLAFLMGGRVGVQSEPDAGALFWLELPRGNAPMMTTTHTPQIAAPSAPLALVVDDDPAARELVELALQAAGYRTAAAATGEEALAAARRIRPHVITLDVFLPGIDGWDVLRVLGSDAATRSIPVVMLTISNDREKAFSLGAVEHLAKPFDQEALAKAIPPVTANATPAMRVLLIAEDPAQVMRMREELVGRGFEVHTAEGGADGLAVVRSDARIDLVLLDSVLRDNAAPDVIEKLRADPRTREMPVVLLAHGDEVGERNKLSRMVQAVLDKSKLEPAELAREVGGVVLELSRQGRS